MITSLNKKLNIKKDRSRSMGRSTRFYGARVLRSGRRVWTGPTADNISNGKKIHCGPEAVCVLAAAPREIENGFDNEDEELVDLKNIANEAVDCTSFKKRKTLGLKGVEVDETVNGFDSKISTEVGEEKPEQRRLEISKIEEKEVEEIVDKMFGLLYRRKRKRGKEHEHIQYFRRKKNRGTHGIEYLQKKSNFDVLNLKGQRKGLLKLSIVVVSFGSRRGGDGSGSSYGIFSSLLHSILRYIWRTDLRLPSLWSFVCSEPIGHVFAAHGIRFLQNYSSVGEAGSCIISCVRSSIPVFSVDFAALPFVFLHLHSSLSLSYARPVYFSETDLSSSEQEEEVNSFNEFSSFVPLKRDHTGCEFVVGIGTTVVALPALGAKKGGHQSVHVKNGCKIQKRRNSVRKRGRPSSTSLVQTSNGASLLNILRPRHNGIQFSSRVSTRQLRGSINKKVTSDVNELKSSLPEMTPNMGSTSCSANILVIESDKCYRVEGALTVLELSESNRWILAIRKDGVKWYSITSQKVMRPCSNNRITHDILWSRDNDLKLEFPNRQDWLIFKELYKECFERNLKMPVPSFIPVPRVSEVEGYWEISCLPFVRPHRYISVKDDELGRTLKKRTANYDMDSDDEEWLDKFNYVYNAEIDVDEDLSAERFELMIDAFEKACHCNPDVITNAEAAYSIFPELERKVVEAVYGRWIMKRKLNRGALVQVFQFYQPSKSQLISKLSRKKRSFKRQGSQASRGKQRSFFHAFVAEQDAIEQQNVVKAQEAKATLDRLERVASQKRRRAQELFENADLAAYKALMAVRIAEAAQHTESTNVAASDILG